MQIFITGRDKPMEQVAIKIYDRDNGVFNVGQCLTTAANTWAEFLTGENGISVLEPDSGCLPSSSISGMGWLSIVKKKQQWVGITFLFHMSMLSKLKQCLIIFSMKSA